MDENEIIKYAIGYLQEAIKALQEGDIDTGEALIQLADDELEKIYTAAQQYVQPTAAGGESADENSESGGG